MENILKAIEFKDAALGFGKKQIISKLNATILDGEFVGIFGPNGSGKTTLLSTVLGLLKPINGTILLYGDAPHRGNPIIGYMPQLRHDLETYPLTGRSYLSAAVNGSGWGIPLLNKGEQNQIDAVIQLVGLQSYIDRPFSQYSGGERQHLALAQALLGKPKILLLDEPLSNLDPGQQEKIIRLIKTIQQRLKMTVLLTAHNINPLLEAMDRILYLAHGKAVIGTVEEVVNSATLSWLYDTPVEVIHAGRNIWVTTKLQERDDHEGSHH